MTMHAPFDACGIPPTVFPGLKGISLSKGFKDRASEIMGGTKGCTHLRELFGALASTAYQTVSASDRFVEKVDSGEIKPYWINTCYTYDESGPVIEKIYPDYFKPREQES